VGTLWRGLSKKALQDAFLMGSGLKRDRLLKRIAAIDTTRPITSITPVFNRVYA
jgi:hypothetical protein